MKILILGGTSFFGKEIVSQLSKAGHKVTVFTRGNKKAPAGSLKGDRENPEDLARAAAAQKWDVVIDNIAFNASHVRGALKTFPNISHYILCSTVSVYRFIPSPASQPMRDSDVSYSYKPPGEDPKDIHWAYARGKLEAERECMKQKKVPWTILRPPVIYGPCDPTDRGFWYLIRLIRGGPMLLANGGVQSFRFLSSTDAARAFAAVVKHRKKVLRKAYFIAHEEVVTLKDFIDEGAKALGVIPEFVNVPSEVLGEMGGPYWNMVNLIPDITEAQKDFDFAPTHWRDNAKSTARWFRDHWKGDESKILSTRSKEMELATQWKKLVGGLKRS